MQTRTRLDRKGSLKKLPKQVKAEETGCWTNLILKQEEPEEQKITRFGQMITMLFAWKKLNGLCNV
ncbi:MAG: hypothetical protein A3F72_19515 [Bacteroidetes bacterium RIFCSPLOWO2_12_FULL_35_15]|nr:MAG: hypothetical protein A3F72_19515 [Bacteroidetes bacterium RIFCSPLOWO2_12_FULL_35_15]